MKTLTVGILALALLVPQPSRAEVSPACRSAVEVALSGYAACDMTARSKDSRRPDAGKLAGELEKCRAKFESKFFSALGRNGSENCTTETSTAFGTYLDGCVVAASDAAGGAALPNPSTCSADLATCETSLAACLATPTPVPTATPTPTPAPATPTPDVTPTPCAVHAPYTDNGDGTVSDSCGLIWEKKTNYGSIHYYVNQYSWSTGDNSFNGTAATVFLATLNTVPCFAGYCDWRLPTIEELSGRSDGGYATGGILDLTVSGCGSGAPCINAIFGPTVSSYYWSSSTGRSNPAYAWSVHFSFGYAFSVDKTYGYYVRAVRGGS